jgi:hypothetical protein
MDERDYKAMNEELNPPLRQTDVSSSILDLTYYRDIQEKLETKKVLSAYFRLDKKTMIQMLSCDKILVNGEYYEVPEYHLLHLLINRQYGETKLDLVKIG